MVQHSPMLLFVGVFTYFLRAFPITRGSRNSGNKGHTHLVVHMAPGAIEVSVLCVHLTTVMLNHMFALTPGFRCGQIDSSEGTGIYLFSEGKVTHESQDLAFAILLLSSRTTLHEGEVSPAVQVPGQLTEEL